MRLASLVGRSVRACAYGCSWVRAGASASLIALSLLGALGTPAVLRAQEPAANGGAAERAASFQAVTGAVKEDVPGGPLLLGAYAVVWLSVLGYVWRLSRLHAGVEDRLLTLERALASAPEHPQKHG